MGELGVSLSKIAENFFKETTYEELQNFIEETKGQINLWSSKYSHEVIFQTSIANQMQTTQTQDSYYNDIAKKMKNQHQSRKVLNQYYDPMTASTIDSLFRTEDAIKEGYKILNQVADKIHGYEITYEVSIPIGDTYYTYRLSLDQFIETLQLNKEGTKFYIGTNRSVYSLSNEELQEQDLTKEDFIKKQIDDFFIKTGLNRTDYIDFHTRNSLIEIMNGKTNFGFGIEEAVKQTGPQFEQPPNLAFYRGPDYIRYIEQIRYYVQSKLINAAVSVSTINNGMRRLIILLDTLEQRIAPKIKSATEKIKSISEDKIIEELIASVFSF